MCPFAYLPRKYIKVGHTFSQIIDGQSQTAWLDPLSISLNMRALDVTEVRFAYIRNIYSTYAYANSIVVSVLSARGNSCYMLHENESCYSDKCEAYSVGTYSVN